MLHVRQRPDGWWEIVIAGRVLSAWQDRETAWKIARLYGWQSSSADRRAA
jgi:hypothetical protein